MSIAFDAVAHGGATTAHTCTGSQLILIVSVSLQGGTGALTCAYNGVSMTLSPDQSDGYGHFYTNGEHVTFYLLNPATGTHNIVLSGYGGATVAMVSASYTGVRQVSQPDNSNGGASDSSSSSGLTGTLTTSADNCWVVLCAGCQINSLAAGTGATERYSYNVSASQAVGLYDNNGAKHPAGSVSESVTFVNEGRYGYSILSIAPYLTTTLTAIKGSFALTGFNALLSKVHFFKIAVTTGIYSLVGKNINLKKFWKMAVNVGHYTLTGINSGLSHIRQFFTSVGKFFWTGFTINIYAPLHSAWKKYVVNSTIWKWIERGQ